MYTIKESTSLIIERIKDCILEYIRNKKEVSFQDLKNWLDFDKKGLEKILFELENERKIILIKKKSQARLV